MYTVKCKYCDNYYESKVNRPGICPDCKKSVIGKKNTKYRDKTYDQILFYVPKGDKENLKSYVASLGMSMNEFIRQAIISYVEELQAEDNEK